MPQPVYTTQEIRRIEESAGAVQPTLMERAGAAAADAAAALAPESGKELLVLAGPGNNGGDAYEAAALLKERFFRVTVVAPAEPAPADARRARDKWLAAGGRIERAVPQGRAWALAVDGLFGIGLARAVEEPYRALIQTLNRLGCPVLSLDVPSGLQSDTGQVLGCAVRAKHTLTFIALKPGLLTLDGPDHCGELRVASLDLDLSKVETKAWVAVPELFASVLKRRPRNFHKGAAGSLGILGGARGMAGAALLAGRAALKLGAGRTYVGLLDHLVVDFGAPELMLRHVDEVLGQDLDAVVAGPGLGRTEHAATLVGAVLASDWPCVLDADALNLIADDANLREACARRQADTLLTPHPAEAARLLGTGIADIQADRVASAKELARRYSAHALLKGNGSVMVARDGHLFINATGNPGMASAGMGDVLSGILGALLAQRLSGESALVLGAHLHGAAADELAASGVGPVGLTAGETIEGARRIWNRWLHEIGSERDFPTGA